MKINTKFEVGQKVWFFGLEGIEERKIEEIVINVREYYSIWYYFERKDNEKEKIMMPEYEIFSSEIELKKYWEKRIIKERLSKEA